MRLDHRTATRLGRLLKAPAPADFFRAIDMPDIILVCTMRLMEAFPRAVPKSSLAHDLLD